MRIQTNIIGNALKGLFKILTVMLVLGGLIFAAPHLSKASHVDPSVMANADGALDVDAHVNDIYLAMRENWVSSFMMMTEQLVSIMIQQTFIIGTFFDAEQQLEVQRLFQQLKAEAHKDFHPSYQMCEFGTNVKSLAASENIYRENAKLLDAVLADRDRLNANLGAAGCIVADVTARVEQFKQFYCDLTENNENVELMCATSVSDFTRISRDLDYPRLIDQAYTLDANFADTSWTTTEQDIVALGRNLYSATVFDFVPEQILNETAAMDLFLDTRSVHAIRSVARHSFTKIVGLKAEGEQGTPYEVLPFMQSIMGELGVSTTDMNDFLGENPSYFAQMEVLTRRLYQRPDFFTNLYDKPANVRRIGVSLQALEIMQDRDRFESALRREMLISLILELKLRKYQEDVNTMLFTASNVKMGAPVP